MTQSTSASQPPPILPDKSTARDRIGFAPHVKAVAETALAAAGGSTPMVIGVVGAPRQGRTSFLRQVEARLREAEAPAPVLVRFAADRGDSAQVPGMLLRALAAAVRARTGDTTGGAEHEQADLAFVTALEARLEGRHPPVSAPGLPVVVLIDDLDRAPDRAVTGLEQALDLPGVAFVCAVGPGEARLRTDLAVGLPRPDRAALRAHLAELVADRTGVAGEEDRLLDVLGDDLGRVKRFANALGYALWFAGRGAGPEPTSDLARLARAGQALRLFLVAERLPRLHQALDEEPALLVALERSLREHGSVQSGAISGMDRLLGGDGGPVLERILRHEHADEPPFFADADTVRASLRILQPVSTPRLMSRPLEPNEQVGPAPVAASEAASVEQAGAATLVGEPSSADQEQRSPSELLRDLDHPSGQVRRAAAESLGAAGESGAVPALIAKLNEPAPEGRRAAVVALGALGDERAVDPLLGLIEDEDPDVRRAAFGALGRIGSDRAVDPLVPKLQDDQRRVRQAALGALVKILRDETDQKLLSRDFDGVHPWLDPAFPIDAERRRRAAEALRLSDKEVVRRYQDLAKHLGLALTG